SAAVKRGSLRSRDLLRNKGKPQKGPTPDFLFQRCPCYSTGNRELEHAHFAADAEGCDCLAKYTPFKVVCGDWYQPRMEHSLWLPRRAASGIRTNGGTDPVTRPLQGAELHACSTGAL